VSRVATASTGRRRRPAREPELTFLRLVPGSSFVHRLWAGTKLLVAFELAIVLTIAPTWKMIAAGTGVVVVGLVAGRIPIGAFPRLPRFFWVLVLISAALNLWSDTPPTVDVGAITLSIGALGDWARLTALTIVLVTSGALIGWTTPLGEVAPALRTLSRPLRWLRLPVDEWVIAIALAIRCLPMLIDEIRSLAAARRLRKHAEQEAGRRNRASIHDVLVEAHDLMATAAVVSIRRARDLADALVARGGIGGSVSAERARFGSGDAFVLIAVTALCVVAVVVLHL
jgi:energy-coupling factor transporter transmembrane protein EcfT